MLAFFAPCASASPSQPAGSSDAVLRARGARLGPFFEKRVVASLWFFYTGSSNTFLYVLDIARIAPLAPKAHPSRLVARAALAYPVRTAEVPQTAPSAASALHTLDDQLAS